MLGSLNLLEIVFRSGSHSCRPQVYVSYAGIGCDASLHAKPQETYFDAVVILACPATCDPELWPLAGTLDQPRHCARFSIPRWGAMPWSTFWLQT